MDTPLWKDIVSRFQRPSRSKATWQLLNTLGPYAALWYAIYRSITVSYWITLPLAVLAAAFLVRIFIIFHDCGHGSFYASRSANRMVGFITGLLTLTPYHHWRWQHALHRLPVSILPYPERPFGPRQARVTAAARRRDRGENTAALRIDLLDAILGELVQVLTVEGRSGMRGNIDRAQHRAAYRIEGVQLVSGGKPNVLTVIRDSIHSVGTRGRAIFTDNLGG